MTSTMEIAAKMRNIARKRTRRYWRRTDREALAEDCEIEGWIGFLEMAAKGGLEWMCWSAAVHSMTDAIVQWFYRLQTYRTREALDPKRIPLTGINFTMHASFDAYPEDVVIAHDLEMKIRGKIELCKNSRALGGTLDDALLDGTLRLRRGTNPGESARVVRGRRVRQLRKITSDLLREKGVCHA